MSTKATPAEIAQRQAYIEMIQLRNGDQSLVDNQWTSDLYAATKDLQTWGLSPENGKWEIDEYGSLSDAIGGTCPPPSGYQPGPATFSLNNLFNLKVESTDLSAPEAEAQASAPEPEPTFPPPPAPPSPTPSPFGNKRGRK